MWLLQVIEIASVPFGTAPQITLHEEKKKTHFLWTLNSQSLTMLHNNIISTALQSWPTHSFPFTCVWKQHMWSFFQTHTDTIWPPLLVVVGQCLCEASCQAGHASVSARAPDSLRVMALRGRKKMSVDNRPVVIRMEERRNKWKKVGMRGEEY